LEVESVEVIKYKHFNPNETDKPVAKIAKVSSFGQVIIKMPEQILLPVTYANKASGKRLLTSNSLIN
jgi:hypothetical protein